MNEFIKFMFATPGRKLLMFFNFLLFVFSVSLAFTYFTAHAQELDAGQIEDKSFDDVLAFEENESLEFDEDLTELMLTKNIADAMFNHVKLCKARGTYDYYLIKSCDNAAGGCYNRLLLYSEYIVEAAKKYNLDPWLLTAIAYHESKFSPFSESSKNARGIFQIHPYSKRGRAIKFVRDKNYRKECVNIPGNCQKEIVFAAADLLVSSRKVCFLETDKKFPGNYERLEDAMLSMYASGKCKRIPKYVKGVRRAYKSLKNGEIKEDKFCSK
jgi:hypothetical protein